MVGRFGCLCLDWQIYQWIIEIAKVSTAMEFVSRTVRKTVPGDAHVAHGWTYEICLVEITFPVNPWCCCCLQCWYSDWYCCSTILMCLNIVCSLYEVLFMSVKNVLLCISVFLFGHRGYHFWLLVLSRLWCISISNDGIDMFDHNMCDPFPYY